MVQSLWLKLSGAAHAVIIPVAVWLWNERRLLKEVLEDNLERRHGEKETKMLNPVAIVTDINLVVNGIAKLQAALPQIEKTFADFKQALADKSDTTKLDADILQLMADVQEDLTEIASVIPATPVTTPAPVPPAAA